MKLNLYERPASEESLLLDELTHRFNNELASAIGAISVAAASANGEDARAVLRRVKLRLENYARLQHALQLPEYDTRIDASVYLRQLCRAIRLSKLAFTGIDLVFVDQPFYMQAVRCWRLGMIVSELVSNASRHAFQSGDGTIRIELVRREMFAECQIADNGCGSPNMQAGRGMKIVEALVKGMDGTLQHYSGDRGTVWVVSFPNSPPRFGEGLNQSNPRDLHV
jgi:two-component sensor histidine kinase